MLGESSIQGNVNKPLTDEVEVVRKVTLPEAVVMGDGDIGSFYDNEEFVDVVPVDISSFSAKDIPAKYDSRDVDGKCYVTPVKDQGYTYLCWTFASMGACESDILKHHSDIGAEDINLSEKHLAYYNMHKATGSLASGIDDDYREFVNDTGEENAFVVEADTSYIACGGVTDFVISILTAWKGPFDDEGNDSFKALYGSYYIFSDNTDVPSDAYGGKYHVQSVMQVPAVTGNGTLIKQMIMEHGAATVGICADPKFFKNHSSILYSSFGGETPDTADHEVLIIGWDDEYSASNFGDTPPGDGAWLCKNSWGPTSGNDGCFYVSYYDETIAISNAAAYDVVLKGEDDWYDNNYQVAGFITNTISTLDDSQNTVVAYSASSNPYGMLYTAQGNESLKAVGLMGLDQYQQYEISVYVGVEAEGDEISFAGKEPVASQKVSAISGGYHTFPLDKAVELQKGDNFFVMIKPYTSGRLVFEEAGDFAGDPNYDEWKNLTGNIHNSYSASGLSFYVSDDGNSMVRQNDKDFLVKAYTVNK
jgi:C1A family cysteine protease